MKTLRSITALSLLILVLNLNCQNENDDPSPQELALQRLTAGEWTLGTTGFVQLDGQDVSANYPGFTLSFNNQQYQTTNAGNLFRASGSWEWIGESANRLITDDDLEITINDLTPNTLEFTFLLTSTRSVAAGTEGIRGDYRIRLVK